MLCESAIEVAYAYISRKMMKLVRYDSSGRQATLVDPNDSKSMAAWRNYAAFACGCPPYKKSGLWTMTPCYAHTVYLHGRNCAYNESHSVMDCAES